jgi:hypothetical protein
VFTRPYAWVVPLIVTLWARLPNHEAEKIAAFLLGVPWLD